MLVVYVCPSIQVYESHSVLVSILVELWLTIRFSVMVLSHPAALGITVVNAGLLVV